MKRALFLLPALLSACGDPPPTDTSGIATRELSLQVIVETDDTETRLAVGIYANGYDYARLALTSGEKLVVRIAGGQPIELTREASSLATYRARLPVVEGSFAIDLERGDDSARDTWVELPPAFTIATPADGLHLDRPFTMTWSPMAPTATMKASIAAECVRVGERTLAHDAGSFTWSAADYVTTNEPPPCTATIRLLRTGGSIAKGPGLAGIQLFRASQVRAFGVLASSP